MSGALSLQQRTEAALALHQSGQLNEAVKAYQAIIADAPDFPDAYHLLGLLLFQAGERKQGKGFVARSINMAPDNPRFLNNYLSVLQTLGNVQESVAVLERLIAIPGADSLDYRARLADLYIGLKRYGEAGALLNDILESDANHKVGVRLSGRLKMAQGQPEDALKHYRHALSLGPRIAINHYNLGNALSVLRQLDEAEASYREAIRLEPDMADAHARLGMVLMLKGDLKSGWPEYEWRWKGIGFPNKQADGPLWNGQAMRGKTLLLTTEQGYGDAFQFAHYASEAARRSEARIVIEAQDAIADLMRTVSGVDDVVTRGSALPPFDAQAPLMTLPRILGASLNTLSVDAPYLFVDENLRQRWGAELEPLPGQKVGIVWRGNPNQLHNIFRSCPVEALRPILDVEGVTVVGLQKDPEDTELEKLPGMVDFGRKIGSFSDTAAIMSHLDLVISVCTSTAHLAGALARPTWVMLSNASDWRWFLDREDCPWYPTARLFRQTELHDWRSVTDRVAAQLNQLANNGT